MKSAICEGQKTDEILENNPAIDRELVRRQRELEKELMKLGVDVKPKFSLEHPLGGTMLNLYKRNK